MPEWGPALIALAAVAGMAFAAWLASLPLRNVAIVDSLWSLMFLAAAVVYAASASGLGPRAGLVLALVAVWAVRLSVHVTRRGWGQPEDHRYQAIRRNNQPGFAWKSLYLVFGLQALLAWILSAPAFAAMAGAAPLGLLDAVAVWVWTFGFAFESVADRQLARFKSDPANRGRVLDTGLWRYSRHPNYFGECCCAWGLWLLAVAAGAWWTAYAPLLLTFLLLRVSGVALLEKDIGERRPAYADYVARTNAFLPGPPRSGR